MKRNKNPSLITWLWIGAGVVALATGAEFYRRSGGKWRGIPLSLKEGERYTETYRDHIIVVQPYNTEYGPMYEYSFSPSILNVSIGEQPTVHKAVREARTLIDFDISERKRLDQ